MELQTNFTEDQIRQFINKFKPHIDTNWIDLEAIIKHVKSTIPEKISKNDFYNYVADYCVSKTSIHPDYNKLASRICVERLHKTTPEDILDVVEILYNNTNNDGYQSPLVSKTLLNNVRRFHKKLNEAIKWERDYLFDYFGIKTLERSYLLKIHDSNKKKSIIERPQHMIMRVALGIHGANLEAVIETYDLISLRYFTHATPTLFNAGTSRPQLSSCFLFSMEDSLDNIMETLKQIALISKYAGGIGVSLTSIRAKGSIIKGTNGLSDGIVPLCGVLNKLSKYVNQGGKRPGSIAVYLEPYHADIYDFMELRKASSGNDDNRARDLFLASWIPDLFMKRVEEDGKWSLMCPNECPGLDKSHGEEFEKLYLQYEKDKKYRRQVRARDLWNHLLECQIETGFTYMCYKDHCNNKSNQKNLGTIRCSNLCVHEDTMILTSTGYSKISSLENEKVNVWNGSEWSEVIVRKTGTNKDLIRVNLSNGSFLDCTPEHKFYTQNNYWAKPKEVQASDLKVDDKLMKMPSLPVIRYNDEDVEEFKYAYTHGFFCGDGTTYDNYSKTKKYPKAYLYGEKKKLLEYMTYESYTENTNSDRYDLVLPEDLEEKFKVPFKASLNDRLRWLEGYVDADGTIAKNGTNEALQITSTNVKFLRDVRLMIQTLGVESKVTLNRDDRTQELPDGNGGYKEYECNATYRCLVSSSGLYELFELGFSPKRLKFTKRKPQRNAEQFVTVLSVEPSHKNCDTFCFTEPKRHLGVFNGIITGQCAEIVEYSDGNTTAVCNLASICLPRFIYEEEGVKHFNYDLLKQVVRVIVRNLNKVIDLNFYPTEQAEKSNKKNRPVGIGVQGESDCFCMMEFAYDSAEAEELNKRIFENIYYAAVDESKELAKKHGHYVSFNGSPFSQGKLQFHLWNMDVKDLLTKDENDWNKLIEEVKEFGTRNSLLTALMPTAGTSQLMRCYESFEPYISNIFVKTTMAGEFIVINEHLVSDLIKLNLWNDDMRKLIIINNGSIQNIDTIPQNIKDVYKTAFEISLKSMISLSADRGPFIDQTQSMNLFMKVPDPKKLTSAHFYAWKRGLKTGMYYLRGSSSVNPIQFGIDIADIIRLTGRSNATELIAGEFGLDIKREDKTKEGDGSVINPVHKEEEGCLMCSS